MRHLSYLLRRFVSLVLLLGVAFQLSAQSTTNVTVRVMSANLNGNTQSYQPFALRIFQGLKPDVVAIQEFNYTSTNGLGVNTPAAFREMLDTTFGTNFVYFRENFTGNGDIPNGIISRYPIVASGSWADTLQSQPNRGYAWAQIAIPGTNPLYVVSVHLLTSSASVRSSEAANLKPLMQTNFPANAWMVLAGDFNTGSRSESTTMSTFGSYLSDNPNPVDDVGNSDTSANRNNPHDYVLPSFSFTNNLTSVLFPSHSYPNGLVFDSRVYSVPNLADFAPVQQADSGLAQHMGVLKDFKITWSATNASGPTASVQPPTQTVAPGGNASFTVTATGTGPLSYQWRFNGGEISAATTTAYTRTNVQFPDAGSYSIVVTNSSGSVTSSIATLIVGVAPAITTQPVGTNVDPGASVTFTVVATGNPAPAFQWQLNGNPISGATASSYSRGNIQAPDTGNYSVVVTNLAGSVTSSNAAVALNSAPVIGTQPQSQTISAGQDATFTVSATGSAPLAYQWRFGSTNLPGATASSYTRTNSQTTDAGDFTVVITNGVGSVTSAVATLTVVSLQPAVIAQWNFNVTNAATLNSPIPSVGTGTASDIGGTTNAWVSGSGSTDTNATNFAWNTSPYPAQGTLNKAAGAQFAVSTAGRQNITIRWDEKASNTGTKYARLQYSTNGTSFADYPTSVALSGATFESKTNSLAAIPGVNNNSNFVFRIVAEFESTAITNANANYVGANGTYGTGGTLRFDMVTVIGTAIPPANPAAPATLTASSFNSNQFHFTVTGTAGSNYVIQAATNLASPSWQSLLTNASPFTFTDTNSSLVPFRFYRAIVAP